MRRIPWWVWVSAAPLGLGAWAPIAPGLELRHRRWTAWGVLWTLLTVAGWIAAQPNDGGSFAGLLVILGWAGAIATTLCIRSSYLLEAGLTGDAERRVRQRRIAQRLAVERPEVARELGVARLGLVDVNSAPLSALMTLPGVDRALARRIIAVRSELDGFDSLADLGATLDLDGHAVERLRERTVFL
jgi:hypothetical protein